MSYITSWVGDHEGGYAYEERFLESLEPRIKRRKAHAREISESPIDTYQPRDALDAIGAIAGEQQVIMINEEHRTPVHRALTLRLLPILYAKGFRYLAAETLFESDPELNKRGYPTQETGYYSADPVFGDLIRTALKIGYKLVPYEHVRAVRCKPSPDNPMSCDDERERGQAKNLIARILQADPQAKILVHAGRDHNAEKSTEYLSMMGWHFKQLSKIDPFTIDQMHMSERRNPADEEPLYRYVTREREFARPTVFQSESGEFWKGGASHDMTVFNPRARYEQGRPTWLKLGGLRKPQVLDFEKLDRAEPVLVQAFMAEEGENAVPVDQVLLYPGKDVPVLMLPSGTMRVRAIDKSGRVLGSYEVTLP